MLSLNRKNISAVKLIIPIFIILMFVVLKFYGLSSMEYLTLVLRRVGMLLIMMLAVSATIHSGVGINYGVSIGFICGLAGAVIGISTGQSGVVLMLLCIASSLPFALASGYGYGVLLNKVKGAEDLISTYTGFAFVSLASIFWVTFNVKNEVLRFANGTGIRIQVSLDGLFKDTLTNFFSVKIGHLVIPVGFLLICLAICGIYILFMRSEVGIRIQICGYNPNYAKAIGLNIDKYRIISVMASTVLAAVGIAFYAQTYGFYEFYTAYLTLGFICVAGILIGGATDKRASMYNIIYGCILYEAILTLSTPIANKLMPTGALPEIIRTLVTNGVILYALAKGGNKSNAK